MARNVLELLGIRRVSQNVVGMNARNLFALAKPFIWCSFVVGECFVRGDSDIELFEIEVVLFV